MMSIRLLENKYVDFTRWDNTVMKSPNARVYALSWYLNIVCPGWHAIVLGDYEYVMPLCIASKFGVKYAFQPVYAQQHGVFPNPTPGIAARFLALLQKKYRYFEIQVNGQFFLSSSKLDVVNKENYILSLSESYSAITDGFTADCKRNLKRAAKANIVRDEIEPEVFFNIKAQHSRLTLDKKTFNMLKRLTNTAVRQKYGFVRGAFSKEGEPTGAALFIKQGKRIMYLNAVSSTLGKKNRSMYAILNSVIQENAETNLLLDFEGSVVPGIAKFFAGFGAQPEHYQKIKYNNLPPVLKLIKK